MSDSGSRGYRNHSRHRAAVSDRPGRALRLLRGLSGALTAGLVAVALALGAAEWLSGPDTVPGPGAGMVIGHGVSAAAAVVLQWVADRSRGGRAFLATVAVLAVVGVVLWTWWWR
ncbi:MAG: hypothetical protein GEV09_15160 [Pseudonocardiaceae bacterium]|nr:hypothetical protein [Pseudonocardiaceae bacterium]